MAVKTERVLEHNCFGVGLKQATVTQTSSLPLRGSKHYNYLYTEGLCRDLVYVKIRSYDNSQLCAALRLGTSASLMWIWVFSLGMQQCMYQCLIGIGCGRFVCYDESYCVGTTSSQFSILEFLMLVGLCFVVEVIKTSHFPRWLDRFHIATMGAKGFYVVGMTASPPNQDLTARGVWVDCV